MKKILIFTILLVCASLASCSDSDSDNYTPTMTSNATFNLLPPTNAGATRAVAITRYIVAIYKTDDPSTVIQRVEQASGTFVISLETNINYTCLFWADGVAPQDNTNGTFNATDLKNVTLNANQTMTEAFFGQLNITNTGSTFTATLKRATAQINIIETSAVTASTDVKIEYEQFPSFNTFTSEAIGTKVAESKTFNSTTTVGTLGSFVMFASTAGILENFKATYSALVINTISSVPLKANFITNVRGRYAIGDQTYTFIINVDDDLDSVIGGVDINLGTLEAPNWIRVADRNAEKDGVNGAAAGITYFGYYYAWSNATNDPSNEEKAYRACFDFAEGNGIWRLPTGDELIAISGDSGNSHTDNDNRKIKFENTQWILYDERIPGQTTNFVNLLMSGINNISSSSTANFGQGVEVAFWSSSADIARMALFSTGSSEVSNVSNLASWGFSVRCVRSLNQ